MLDDYFTSKCDFRGKHCCHRSGCRHDAIPEEIVVNAATVSGTKHCARVDFTFKYEDLYKLVRTWAIPKDTYRADADSGDHLEEIHRRQTCEKSPGGSQKLLR